MDKFALQQIISRIPPLKFQYLGSLPSDHVPTLDNDTFAIINTQPQPSKMQGEHWLMIANFRKNCILQTLLDVRSTVSQAALHANDASTPTVSPKCMQLLYKLCSFSSLQVSARRKNKSSRC